jgi:PilZ domain-containing protein
MEERRKVQRSRTYLGGRIAFNRRFSTLDCLVRNLSQDGAMIAFSDAVAVPGEFDVLIPWKGESRRARVIWSNETRAGVAFVDAIDDNVVSIETALRFNKLQAEREALARRVAQLSEPA